MADRQGSLVGIVDDVGSVINQITYNGYGEITNETDSLNGDRYTYTSRERDIDGLMHYRDRVLSHDT